MRVVFMGTPDFAVSTLEEILSAGHEAALVVTQPDKPKGRGNVLTPPPVKECALSHGLTVYQPKRVRDAECIGHIKEYAPDIIIVAAFGQILPKELLQIPRFGCVNVHASLLPKYRGAAPIQWAVINGDAVSGVTTMRMDEGLDTGDMIEREEVRLSEDETGGSLFLRLAQAGAKLCVHTMRLIEEGSAVYTPQDASKATHVGMIRKEMGQIDWQQPARAIERLVRGLNPWPSAFTHINGKTLKIWRAKAEPGGSPKDAGKITEVTGKELRVQTADGILSLLEVQLEGKKRMDTEAFLRGYKAAAGMRLS